jgi:hypothetical protein
MNKKKNYSFKYVFVKFNLKSYECYRNPSKTRVFIPKFHIVIEQYEWVTDLLENCIK